LFRKSTDIKTIYLNNFKCCSVDITDERGFIKYEVEMPSGGMIHEPSFMKIGTGDRELLGGTRMYMQHRKEGDLIRLPLFFQNK
jgi:hypothetical protein